MVKFSTVAKQKDWSQDICLSKRAKQSMWLTTSECGMMYSSVIQQPIIVVISYEHTSSHLSSLGMEMCPVASASSRNWISINFEQQLESNQLKTTKFFTNLRRPHWLNYLRIFKMPISEFSNNKVICSLKSPALPFPFDIFLSFLLTMTWQNLVWLLILRG